MVPLSPHSRLRRVATVALVLNLVAAAAGIAWGVYECLFLGERALGVVLIGGSIGAALFGLLLYCQVVLVHKFVSYAYRAYQSLLESAELLRRQEEHTRTIAENSNLSDWAKRVAYRERDYEFLRDTINAAIVRQDWESAEHLIGSLEKEFGYLDEAGHLRERLQTARRATNDERVAAALARFEALCADHKWAQAHAECERLSQLFAGDARIAGLPQELERRRQDVKRQLLKEYDAAVRSQDVDRAHRLLFELDQYLVPQEAEALKPSARSVFRARLEQLKTQFGIAVSYKQFYNAIGVGEQLIREFPNSGYAHEITKLLPVLRDRARQLGSPHAVSTTHAVSP